MNSDMSYYTFFPTPYVEETLYSVLCRYHLRSGNSSSKETMRQLWGEYLPITSVEFMMQVDVIAAKLNPTGGIDSSQLVWEHTPYPYIYISLKENRALDVYQMICGNAPMRSGIDSQAGIPSQRNARKYLRYCPACMQEDIEKYGETYWHRVHQLQGVFVCPKHKVPTYNSNISVASTRWRFWPASHETRGVEEKLEDIQHKYQNQLFDLSCDSAWILNNARKIGCKEELTEKYHSILKVKGFMNAGGRTDYERLCKAVADFYGQELLQLVLNVALEQCLLWVRKIVSPSSKGVQPIHHLLFMRFLCGSPQKFVETRSVWEPYGQAPWPCHNKICPHYLENVIEPIEIIHDRGFCVADFICPYCGFTYRRKRPVSKEDQYEKNVKIMHFGHFWEQKLKDCLCEKKQNITETSRTMKCSKGTVYKHAQRLCIIEKSQYVKTEKCNPHNDRDSLEVTREQRRGAIKKLIDLNPEIKRSDLWRANQRDYEWLRNNDQEWFDTFIPPRQNLKTDWKKRDKDWLKLIRKTYEKMSEDPCNLKRISIYSLFNEAGLNKNQIYLHKEKLPQTMNFLNENIETMNDWRRRKIDYAIKNLLAEGKLPSMTTIQKEVGISDKEFKKHVKYVEEVLHQYNRI